MTAANPIKTWDFMVPEKYVTKNEIKQWCEETCDQWCFQLEKGEGGLLHYQGRIKLKEKTRVVIGNIAKECHWSATAKSNRDNMFYVMKEKTREAGPWTDQDEELFIQARVARIKKWKPWQQQIIDISKIDTNSMNPTDEEEAEERQIHVIWDPIGKKGKSTLVAYFDQNDKGLEIPDSLEDPKEVIQYVHSFDPYETYMYDLPRASDGSGMRKMIRTIETIKNGKTYDNRYKGRRRWMKIPHIFIFTNILPNLSFLSEDRWRIYKINKKQELEEIELHELIDQE